MMFYFIIIIDFVAIHLFILVGAWFVFRSAMVGCISRQSMRFQRQHQREKKDA